MIIDSVDVNVEQLVEQFHKAAEVHKQAVRERAAAQAALNMAEKAAQAAQEEWEKTRSTLLSAATGKAVVTHEDWWP